MKVSEALWQIAAEVEKASGYPYPPNSTVDPNLALAYGIVIGSILLERDMWKQKEEEYDRAQASQ